MFEDFDKRYIVVKLDSKDESEHLLSLLSEVVNNMSSVITSDVNYTNYLYLNIDSLKEDNFLRLSFLSINVSDDDVHEYIIENSVVYDKIYDISNIDELLYFLENGHFKKHINKPNYNPKINNRILENINDKYEYLIVKVNNIMQIRKLEYDLKNILNFDDVNMLSEQTLSNFRFPNYLFLDNNGSNRYINILFYSYNLTEENMNSMLYSNPYWYKEIFTISDIKKIGEIMGIHIYPDYKPKKIIRKLENKIIKFNEFDIDNLEFRKGSQEYGDLVSKLVEYLRIYKNENDDKLIFNISDFEKDSNLSINDINMLNNLPSKKSLFEFDIEIKDGKIIFSNLQNKKSVHHMESINEFDDAIRNNYTVLGVDDFYKKIGDKYKNPHLSDIQLCMDDIIKKTDKDDKILDLGAGNGEITTILKDKGFNNIIGCDPYLYKQYEKNTGEKCLDYSFEDIQKGALNNFNFDTIICSYSIHLANNSILPDLLWNLSLISKKLIIISPNNKPNVNSDNGWEFMKSFKINKCKTKIYNSKNK